MQPVSEQPLFAVVGHPNKGKSSIVATLARDDSIAIAADPGTTRTAQRFPMSVDGQTLYTLIDTPGFQRARRVLAWLEQHAESDADRPAAVERFVRAHRNTGEFPDEVELLTPIIEGAGILYVVDGSIPYGSEYKAEMEVLRWTGRPRMALINPIGQADHIDQWQSALDQHFNNVRIFNALTADFEKQMQILEAFSQLRESWREPLQRAVDALKRHRKQAQHQSAEAIADMLVDMMQLQVRETLDPDADPEPRRKPLEEKYKAQMRRLEQREREAVESAYQHFRIQRVEQDVELREDLFSERSWVLFGLSRWQLIAAGGATGGALGIGADAAAGGLTFGVFTTLGTAAGAGAAWWSAQKLPQARVLWHRVGGKTVQCGPVRNPNFPFVVLNRALRHHALVAGRSHAQRGELTLSETPGAAEQQRGALNMLSEAERKALSPHIRRIGRGDRLDAAQRAELVELLERVLAAQESGQGRAGDLQA